MVRVGVNKRYYWLRLKKDFFDNRQIKKLRKIAGGDTYTIIYLKLQLLSIANDGIIEFKGTEKDIFEQLELEIDEDMDNIKITMGFLKANNLMEWSDDEVFLNEVPELIGSETQSAERMRKSRENRKKALKNCNNVTHECNNVTHECNIVQNCYTEKEKEIEKELEKEKETKQENAGVVSDIPNLDNPQLAVLIKLYQDCGFGLITPYSANMLQDFMQAYSFEWVKEAIEIAEQNGIRTLSYVRGVLNKKKSGRDKQANFKNKSTYYKPKQEEQGDNRVNDLNKNILNSFMANMKNQNG